MNCRKLCFILACIIIIVFILDFCLAIFSYDSMSLRMWYRASSFNRVHKGMTKNQVMAIVGPPKTMEKNPAYIEWTYNNTASKYSSAGVIVNFGANYCVTEVCVLSSKSKIIFKKIKPGMTQNQVLQYVGKPDRVWKTCAERWIYSHWGEANHKILFDNKGRVEWTGESCKVLTLPSHSKSRSYFHD